MKILIISGAFFPDNSPRSFRSTELVKEFCRQGHDVTYIGSYKEEPHHALVKEFGFNFIDVGRKKLQMYQPSSNSISQLSARVINKLTNYFFEYPDIEWTWKIKKVLKSMSGFDLMISIAVPHPIHWGVAWASDSSKKIAKTWVADCGDSYYLNKLEKYPRLFYFKWIESYWCKKVDFIASPMAAMKVNFLPPYRHKCIEIPQGFKIEESKKYLKPYSPNKIPTFCFSGSFIPGSRDPKKLLEYLVDLNIDFRFYIFTMLKNYVHPYMEKAKGRIILYDYIPRNELLSFQSQMDFLVNFTFNPEVQVPSKLIDYLITDKPILNIEEDLDSDTVDQFLKGDYSNKFDKLSLERYKIENVCKKFLALTHQEHLTTAHEINV